MVCFIWVVLTKYMSCAIITGSQDYGIIHKSKGCIAQKRWHKRKAWVAGEKRLRTIWHKKTGVCATGTDLRNPYCPSCEPGQRWWHPVVPYVMAHLGRQEATCTAKCSWSWKPVMQPANVYRLCTFAVAPASASCHGTSWCQQPLHVTRPMQVLIKSTKHISTQ